MPPEDNKLRLIIEIDENQVIQVHGPIGNKVLCYGMLDAAKDLIRLFVDTSNSRIIPAISLPQDQQGKGH